MYTNFIILVFVLIMGVLYYVWSLSKNKMYNNYAFFMKVMYLFISLILAFTKKDFIVMGNLTFGGRTSVMILIVIEIVDAFIDRKKANKVKHKKCVDK